MYKNLKNFFNKFVEKVFIFYGHSWVILKIWKFWNWGLSSKIFIIQQAKKDFLITWKSFLTRGLVTHFLISKKLYLNVGKYFYNCRKYLLNLIKYFVDRRKCFVNCRKYFLNCRKHIFNWENVFWTSKNLSQSTSSENISWSSENCFWRSENFFCVQIK